MLKKGQMVLSSNICGLKSLGYGGNWGPFCTRIETLLERLFYQAAFLALAFNFGKLIGIDAKAIYIDLNVVREQVFILLLLCHFIAKMDETRYRRQVLAYLKVMLVVFCAGGVAKQR